MKIDTKGRDFIANGRVFHADKQGFAEVPDDILKAEKGVAPKKAGEKDQGKVIEGLKGEIAELGAENERLKARVFDLEKENTELNALLADDGSAAKDSLVARAVELKIESSSVLKRWGEDKLKAAIAEAEARTAAAAGAQG